MLRHLSFCHRKESDECNLIFMSQSVRKYAGSLIKSFNEIV